MEFVAAENPNVKVFNIHPGVVNTDMHRNSGNKGAVPEDDSEYSPIFSVIKVQPGVV
jgi:hypothetical protein